MPTTETLPKKPEIEEKELVKTRIIQTITFFGDSAIPEEDEIYQSVWNASKLLAQNGFSVVNGGGPGIMKAATDGAESVGGKTIAVYWEPKLASFFEGKNLANVTDDSDADSNYVMRTLGLIERGDVYIVCKGGTGTISEFGLVWCLAKLYYGSHKPVILYGDFWPEIIEAIQKGMYIDEKELAVLYYATTPEEVLDIIVTHEKKIKHSKIKTVKSGDEAAFILGSRIEDKTTQTYNKVASEYHSHNSLRYKNLPSKEQLREFKTLVNAPAMVLDVGSGTGLDSGSLAEKYAVTAIEVSKRMSEICKYENPNVDVVNADIRSLPLPKGTYKGIWARDSLHHIPDADADAVFQKLADALVEEGILYVIVRQGNGMEDVEIEHKPYGSLERYYYLYSVEELIDRAKRAGLEMVKMDHIKRSHNWLAGVFRKPGKV